MLAVLGLTNAASAATINLPDGFGDSDFTAICSDGVFNQACAVAVAEIRVGNASPNGDQELVLREPDPSVGGGFGGFNGQLGITSGAPLDLLIDYTGPGQELSLMLGGATTSSNLMGLDLSSVTALFVRLARQNDGDLAFTDLAFNGTPLAPFPDAPVSYIAFAADDFTAPFQITGSVMFSFDDDDKLGSRLSAQFNFTDVDLAPIPLPAGLPLALAGIGAFAWLRRRQRA